LPPRGTAVSLITTDAHREVAKPMAKALKMAGFSVTPLKVGDELSNNQDIISCINIEKNLFGNINEEDFYAFRNLIRPQGTEQNLLWLTSPAQVSTRTLVLHK
jgi:hypothetical protein